MPNTPSLLARLLDAPDLATIVPRLQPEVLHRVVQACGLEDCAEFVALATPEQLAGVLDLDIWRTGVRGAEDEFDAERFAAWIAVLMQSGAAIAAEKLVALDLDLVVAGYARHAAVFDHAAVSGYTTLDGEHVPGRSRDRDAIAEIGGYVIEARRTSPAWDAMIDLLVFLHADHGGYFHQLMRECVRLSSGPQEEDAGHDLLADDEQDLFDLACDREARRERQGYVTSGQAHAFLRGSRDLQFQAQRPARNAVAQAYLRPTTPASDEQNDSAHDGDDQVSHSDTTVSLSPAAGVMDVLRDAGVLSQPRPMLAAADPQAADLACIKAHVEAHPDSAAELAFLTNAIMVGCSVQGRSFTIREAGEGAVATANLGLENWPARWPEPDLVTAFQVGWTILNRDVCAYAAERLIDVLDTVRCIDLDIQVRLNALRRDLTDALRAGEPWRAQPSLDTILSLDGPAWAVLVALIGECPVVHAALDGLRQRSRTISPTDFTFISQNQQIAAVREFMAMLPRVLSS